MSTCVDSLTKHHESIDTFGIDFSPQLVESDTLASVQTVEVSPTGELTVSGQAVNAAEFSDPDGKTTIAIGKGVVAQFSGGTAGSEYVVTVVVNATSGRRIGVNVTVGVV